MKKCHDCKAEAQEGYAFCTFHREKRRRRAKEGYQRMVAEKGHGCPRCGSRAVRSTLCQRCTVTLRSRARQEAARRQGKAMWGRGS